MSEKHASLLNILLSLLPLGRPACFPGTCATLAPLCSRPLLLGKPLALLYSILCGVPSAMAVLCRLAKSWGKGTVRTHAAASLLAECTNHSMATYKWSRSMPDDEVIRRLWRASCSDPILANDGQHQVIPKSVDTMSFLASCHTQPLFQYTFIGDTDFQ